MDRNDIGTLFLLLLSFVTPYFVAHLLIWTVPFSPVGSHWAFCLSSRTDSARTWFHHLKTIIQSWSSDSFSPSERPIYRQDLLLCTTDPLLSVLPVGVHRLCSALLGHTGNSQAYGQVGVTWWLDWQTQALGYILLSETLQVWSSAIMSIIFFFVPLQTPSESSCLPWACSSASFISKSLGYRKTTFPRRELG